MIRINLINNKIKDAEGQGGQGILITNDKQGQKENVIKVVLMLVFVLGLYLYESNNLEQLELKQKNLKARADKGASEVVELRKTAGRAEEVQKEINQLQEKLNILQDLSKKRLRELKALDFLQTVMPEGVWLSKIDYDGKNVNFGGGASNDNDLEQFISGLTGSAYFSEVVVVSQRVEKTPRGSVTNFQITSEMVEQ